MMGVCGLFFFMVGYARERKDLEKSVCVRISRRIFLAISRYEMRKEIENDSEDAS